MGTLTTLALQQRSLSEPSCTCDPFEYADGHYVGHDGFVVPKDFAEFYERFPDHIRRWVKRHADRCSSKEDIDDWTQDLCAHMSSLPATSKYRRDGKRDVVQTFDPFRHYGASLPRFLNYVNRCLANKFRTIHAYHMKGLICRAGPRSFSDIFGNESAGDKPHRALLEKLNAIDFRSRKQVDDKLLIAEFVDFVRAHNPPLLSVLGTMTGTQTEAGQKLCATEAEVGRLYRQIRELGSSFLSRKRPMQRKQRAGRRYRTKATASIPDLIPPPVRLSADFNSTCWNRVELYKEVWNQPLVQLSRKYGISDVRLGKVCRRLKIPHPGRGYWAKRTVGQHLAQISLSEFPDAPVVRRVKHASRKY
jgi:hypothetical protein